MSTYNGKQVWTGGTQLKSNIRLTSRWPLLATLVSGAKKLLGLLGVGR